jgi:hypothetical protein
MWASYWVHLNGALKRHENKARNGSTRFNFSKSWDTSKPSGLDGLKQKLGLLLTKKTTRVFFGIVVKGIVPLKPSIND